MSKEKLQGDEYEIMVFTPSEGINLDPSEPIRTITADDAKCKDAYIDLTKKTTLK